MGELSAGGDRLRLSRRVVFALSVAAWLGLFVLIPSTVGRRGGKLGWRGERPSLVNRSGVVPLGLGAAGLGWCLSSHYAPGERVPVSLVPETLIANGPYRLSRNPMYVCEQMVLLGWTVYYGSPALLAGMAGLGAGMRYAVRREERTLEDRFGDSWRQYASEVRRWI